MTGSNCGWGHPLPRSLITSLSRERDPLVSFGFAVCLARQLIHMTMRA